MIRSRDTYELDPWCSISNSYRNDKGGNIENMVSHPSICNSTLNKRVCYTTTIKHLTFSVLCELSWYFWEARPWDLIATTINESFSTVTPAGNRSPNRNYNRDCENSHIKGGNRIMMHGCATILSYLSEYSPYNQTSFINYFISHNTIFKCYGDGMISISLSCAMSS